MKVAIMPRFTELRIIINHGGELTFGPPSAIMPWMYAPWPEAKDKGVIEIEIDGETLIALVTHVADLYQQAGVDFNPVDPVTGDIDLDYEVILNGKDYEGLPDGLDTKLKNNDEVCIKMAWRWDG